ncbi:MAG TPA: ribosome biogenesis GTPase Der, partial [Myxococcota bacterium]
MFAIVGRPNVGKSTLFNRLAGRPIAIVEDVPGVTRDRIYAKADFYVPRGGPGSDDGEVQARATLIDTGGFEPAPSTELFAAVREQTELAIAEADVILHVVDGRQGVSPDDVEVARLLRKSGRPLVLAVNKMDSPKQAGLENQFWELGVDQVFPIAAAHALGVGALLEAAFEKLPQALKDGALTAALEEEEERALTDRVLDEALDEAEAAVVDDDELDDVDDAQEPAVVTGPSPFARANIGMFARVAANDDDSEDDTIDAPMTRAETIVALPEVLRIAVVGRPNAGKSSFVNKLLGEERHLVSDVPGTTVDSIDSFLEHGGRRFRLIDTAGIRRKRSIGSAVEKHAVVSALKGMDRADVVLLLIDANMGLADQDLKIASFADEKNKAVVVVVNKWDLARAPDRKQPLDAEVYAKQIREQMPFLAHAPIRFISAKTGKRVFDVLDTAVALAKEHFRRVPTGEVNRALAAAIAGHQPPMFRGKRMRFYFGTQVKAAPPTFVIATNDTDGVH